MSSANTLAHAIRFLSIDAVEHAQSGHPGMPLGMADIAYVLWHKFLKHNPKNPRWFNRDRFILSNGHGSMLLYALLHLTGYNLTIQDLKQFRQLHSKTPGHPEYLDTPGVETTTGPLGQGLANAVGMAIAEKILAQQYNRPNLSLVDHYTYVFVGDGCLMEGISHEACSFAGTLGLGKLIVFYDDNGISIDGEVNQWFRDDTAARFKAYHWQVIDGVDGHNQEAIEQAILSAQKETSKPTLIICKTIIGYGSTAAGSESVHGSPLGAQDIKNIRQHFDWPYAPFELPQIIYDEWSHIQQGQDEEQRWLETCHQYQQTHTRIYHEFLRRIQGDLPDQWSTHFAVFFEQIRQNRSPMATRKASQVCLESLAPILPELLGGSADLTGSNNTNWSGSNMISHESFDGNYIHYGVREFGMSAMMSGLALHGGFIPYGGTFLVFADYARNAVRLSAMMKQRVIYIYSHDSIGLGEDGPTHQPIEHIAMLRMTPNLRVWRPADLMETAVAWLEAINHHQGPSCLLLSRQSLPCVTSNDISQSDIQKGGYVIRDCEQTPDAILIATGSEVHLALAAQSQAKTLGIQVRVVSMPCVEQFLAQDIIYQNTVLPTQIRKRIAIEAAATAYWYRFVGIDGAVVGIDSFGLSAPANEVYQALEVTTEKTLEILREWFQ